MLSINAYAPVIHQASDSYHERLVTEKEEYTITEGIGFDKASLVMYGEMDYLLHWLMNGLVRDVVWKSPLGNVIWEGFASRLIYSFGGVAWTRAIEGMANRILYVYRPIDTSANPPTSGAQTTVTKNDTSSQDQYGIKTGLVDGGECTAATADDNALGELTIRSAIPTTETRAIGGESKAPMLKVEMLGYAYMANWFAYEQTANTGTDNASTILPLVLAADPNGVLATEATYIDSNALAVEKYWDGKMLGWKVVQTITGRGNETGGVGYQWTCGVYEGRRLHYKAAESVDGNGVALSTNQRLTLMHRIHERGDVYLNEAGDEVMPWDLRPDRLVYTQGIPGPPEYVQQVKFTAPFRATLTGTDVLNATRQFIRGEC